MSLAIVGAMDGVVLEVAGKCGLIEAEGVGVDKPVAGGVFERDTHVVCGVCVSVEVENIESCLKVRAGRL